MSLEYDQYLKEHRENVEKAFNWFVANMFDVLPQHSNIQQQIVAHDASKNDFEEYAPYDVYFYGGPKTKNVIDAFNKAWLRHIHLNPHHWQYWVLVNDDEPEEALEMPVPYVIEMICDWWSFSWKKGDLFEIFDWYEKHKNMRLHLNTRKLVEDILASMKSKLEATNDDALG